MISQTAEKRKQQNGAREEDKPPSSSASSDIFGNKRNEIFKIIAKEISPTDFLSIARRLKFDDNEIKNIELHHRSIGTRTMVFLELYENKMSSINPLLRTLGRIGRSDVVKKIESL